MADQDIEEQNGLRQENGNDVEDADQDSDGEDDGFNDVFLFPPSLEKVSSWPKGKLLARPTGESCCGCTYLHHALSLGTDADVCRVLMERAPELLTTKNNKGHVPLVNIAQTNNVEIAMMVVDQSPPEAINNVSYAGYTSLGYAISDKADPRVLLAMMAKADDSMFAIKDKDGRLPVHSAIRVNTPVHVIQEIIRRSPPDILVTADDKGNLPIHLAVTTAADNQRQVAPEPELVELLMDQTPKATLEALFTDDGSNLLHKMSVLLAPESVELLLDRLPSERFLRQQDNQGRLPIHSIVQRDAPEAFLKAFFGKAAGGADCLLMTDGNNHQVALHYAAKAPGEVTSLDFLLEQSGPEALFWKDKDGFLPIHHFIKNGKPVKMIQRILARCRELEERHTIDWGSLGRDSIRCALLNDYNLAHQERRLRRRTVAKATKWNIEVADLFLEAAAPVALLEMYDDGKGEETLLHEAIRTLRVGTTQEENNNARSNDNVNDWLVERGGANALNKPNSVGMLPLHCILERGYYPFGLVLPIIQGYPHAVHLQDNYGRLPLHVACLRSSTCELSTIYLLLRMAPTVVLSSSRLMHAKAKTN